MTWDSYKYMHEKNKEPGEHKTFVQCPKCDQYLYMDNTIIYSSVPPKHRYFCKECGWEEFL